MQKSQLGIELCDTFPDTPHMFSGHLHGPHGQIKTSVRRIFDQASDQAVTKLGVQGKNAKSAQNMRKSMKTNENQWKSMHFTNFAPKK